MYSKAARLAVFIPALITANVAQAYIGPGAGLSAIGSALALIGAVLLMIVGFVWYPVKRLMKRKKAPETEASATRTSDKRGGEREQQREPEADGSHSQSRP